MDEVKSLLSKLEKTDLEKQQEDLITNLTKLVIEINEDDDDNENGEVQNVVIQNDVFTTLVSSQLESVDKAKDKESLVVAFAKLVAELAKTESVREPLTTKGIIPSLLNCLSSGKVDLATQACRALGNICYDNDAGRHAVDEAGGIATILNVLSKQIGNTEEGASQLRVILCGFLLNLTNCNEVLQSKAVDANVLDVLNQVMVSHLQDNDLTNMSLLTIGSITDNDAGKLYVGKSDLLSTFKSLLDQQDNNANLTGVLLDLLNGIMESEPAKDRAAEIGLCQSLISVINNYQGQEAEFVKVASDVLVSILVGDKSMELVYEGGEGPVFLQCLKWLDADVDELKTLGCLAIGNFARRDSYCVELVNKGIVDKLLPLLKSGPDESFYLQHAVLSTLRNLAIPAANKPRLLEHKVMEACLCLVNSEIMPVVFKLLGLLRMLIEGQDSAAVKLGQERGFLDCLSEWCNVEVHAGVKGEAPRVIASLIKNSRSLAVIQNLIRANCIGQLVAMALSEHHVMQNEALVALTAVCSTSAADAAVSLKEADLPLAISKLLKDDKLPPEMLCNVLSLTRAVMTAENLQEEMMSSSLVEAVRDLHENHADIKVKDAARDTLTHIENIESQS